MSESRNHAEPRPNAPEKIKRMIPAASEAVVRNLAPTTSWAVANTRHILEVTMPPVERPSLFWDQQPAPSPAEVAASAAVTGVAQGDEQLARQIGQGVVGSPQVDIMADVIDLAARREQSEAERQQYLQRLTNNDQDGYANAA